jgi:hypothetical protein
VGEKIWQRNSGTRAAAAAPRGPRTRHAVGRVLLKIKINYCRHLQAEPRPKEKEGRFFQLLQETQREAGAAEATPTASTLRARHATPEAVGT